MQKKINTPSVTSFYSLNSTPVYLVVGLGNPGEKYKLNYHNAGFLSIDDLVSKNNSSWHLKNSFNAEVSEFYLNDNKIIGIKPNTFMNNSGDAVKKVLDFYKINLSNLIVVYDDFDLEFGTIRTRFDGSSGGHNGIESIINSIGEKFNRIRIGIRSDTNAILSASDIVLKNFSKDEQLHFADLYKEVNSIIYEFVHSHSENINAETRSFIFK